MLPAELLRELEALCVRAGLVVREEPFHQLHASFGPRASGARRGGMCRVNGKAIVIVDAALPAVDKIGVLCEALASLELSVLEAAFVPPFLRARIERRRTRGAKLPIALAKARRRVARANES